jgi:hypothetical protein
MNKKPPNPSTEAANDDGSQVKLPSRMKNIPTTPNIPNLWIINVPKQEPQAPKEKAPHNDNVASSAQQLAQLLIPQQDPQAQKEKARCDDNLASSAHQLAQLLVPQRESQAQKEKARCDATLASSAQQLAQLLSECQNLPCISTKSPKRDNRDIIPQPLFDLQSNLFNKIKAVISTPCATLTPPEFSFEFTDKGAAHNLELLRKYVLDRGKALKVQQDSLLGNLKEFKPPSVLQQLFGLHPLWNQMEASLLEGSEWSLV